MSTKAKVLLDNVEGVEVLDWNHVPLQEMLIALGQKVKHQSSNEDNILVISNFKAVSKQVDDDQAIMPIYSYTLYKKFRLDVSGWALVEDPQFN